MRTFLKRLGIISAIVAFAALLAAPLWAQDLPTASAPDWMAELVALLESAAIVGFVTRVSIWLGVLLLERLPKWAVPILAFALPWAIDALVGLPIDDPALKAAIGLLTIGLREIVDKFLTGPFLSKLSIAGKPVADRWVAQEGNFLVSRKRLPLAA